MLEYFGVKCYVGRYEVCLRNNWNFEFHRMYYFACPDFLGIYEDDYLDFSLFSSLKWGLNKINDIKEDELLLLLLILTL